MKLLVEEQNLERKQLLMRRKATGLRMGVRSWVHRQNLAMI